MPHSPYPVQDDEVDLFELAENLWQQKWMILGITAVVTLIATAAAFMIPPTYKSEAIISQTSAAALAPINRFSASQAAPSYSISGTQRKPSDQNSSSLTYDTYTAYLEDYNLTPEQSFMHFYKALTSADTLKAAFRGSLHIQTHPGLNTMNEKDIAVFYEKWRENLEIKLIKSDVPRINITLTEHDPALAATIINDYLIPLAIQEVIDDEEQTVTAGLNLRKASLLNDIQVIEQRYIDINLNRQNQLKLAIAMAEASGITKPQPYNIADNNNSLQHIFLFGTDALRAELTQIQAMLNQYRSIAETGQSNINTPLIPGTAEKFYHFQQVNRIKPDFSHFAPVHIEQHASVPLTPEKPGKKLIMAVGLMLGVMLSVFIALIRTTIQNRKAHMQVVALSAETPRCHPEIPA